MSTLYFDSPTSNTMKLGISLGTRLTGLALMTGRSLELWQIKNFEERWSERKLASIVKTIDRYLEDYAIIAVTIKIPEPCRSSFAIVRLTEVLMRLCERKGIRANTCTTNDLKLYCNVRNRREMMTYATKLYPELGHVKEKADRVKKVYYVKIFEAVLSALISN